MEEEDHDLCAMSKQPLVSIIMAAKDTAPYIAQCLDSIIAQTYTNWELIAINDHSDDATPEIIADYAKRDARIKLVHSKRRKLIPALKEGYAHCNGPLMNRMDSDDRMPADKLEVMVAEWMKHGKGNVIAGGTEHFCDDGEVGDGFQRYDRWLNHVAKEQLHLQEIYRECVIPSHCWLLHKDDLDAIDAFNPEIYPEDYDLTFRMYRHRLNIIGIDKVLHHWRDRSDRISRTWEVYKDNRYYEMKLRYFLEIDREADRPLVLWGAGRNGKDMAKLLLDRNLTFSWVCDNERKIGHDVYGVIMQATDTIAALENPQIIIVVASPDGQKEIEQELEAYQLKPRVHYWFFN